MPGQFVDEDIPFTVPTQIVSPSVSLDGSIGRAARPYNALLVDLTGAVTVSGAGADVGYGINDAIDRFTLNVEPQSSEGKASAESFALVNNVRWFCFYQFARDFGFVPPVTQAGAGTGSPAVRSTFVIPVGLILPTDTVTFIFTTAAFAAVGTTITAWSLTLTFRPMVFGAGQGPTGTNTKALIGYKEYILDVVASAASAQVVMKPGPKMSGWRMACLYVIRNESARGTLADGWDWFQVYIGGVPVAGIQTPEIIHKVRATLKTRVLQVAGIMPVWFTPAAVTNADYFEYDNEATATTAGTSALGVYLVSR